jgi:hypothetical protein
MALHDKAVDEATSYKQMCFNGYDIKPTLDDREALRAALTEALHAAQPVREPLTEAQIDEAYSVSQHRHQFP